MVRKSWSLKFWGGLWNRNRKIEYFILMEFQTNLSNNLNFPCSYSIREEPRKVTKVIHVQTGKFRKGVLLIFQWDFANYCLWDFPDNWKSYIWLFCEDYLILIKYTLLFSSLILYIVIIFLLKLDEKNCLIINLVQKNWARIINRNVFKRPIED